MEIQKIFSDEYNEERLYSILMNEEEYDLFQSMYSKSDEKVDLKDLSSNRGLGRALILGGPAGAVGGYFGNKHAERIDESGDMTDSKVIKEAGKRGALVGAGAGAAGGAILSGIGVANMNKIIKKFKKFIRINGDKLPSGMSKATAAGIILGTSALGAGRGALGGYLGSKKNTKTKIDKRRDIEDFTRRALKNSK